MLGSFIYLLIMFFVFFLLGVFLFVEFMLHDVPTNLIAYSRVLSFLSRLINLQLIWVHYIFA